MSDGTLVNPVYFIEFGFGIEGQENPMQNRVWLVIQYQHYIEGWISGDKTAKKFLQGKVEKAQTFFTIQYKLIGQIGNNM